jgi:serine/threonine protein kinase/predicted Zn-dependent protease
VNAQPSIDVLIDSAVDAFEAAKASGRAVLINDFLPDPTSPSYKNVLVELLRVDMEHAWWSEHRKTLSDYVAAYSSELADPELLTELAFEEFRLRREAGEMVSVDQYARNPSIRVEKWPHSDTRIVRVDQEETDTLSLDEVQADVDALTRAICLLPAAESTFSEFKMIREIGRGAFGRVFLALQQGLAERPVVLKITGCSSTEPHHLAQLQHTNVVPIYSVHQRDDLQAVCMPYFGCCTMGHLLRAFQRQGTLPATGSAIMKVVRAESARISGFTAATAETESTRQLDGADYCQAILRLARQIADGLAHAHVRDIVHKDLKPANVLITDDGRAMLLDFNLSDRIVPRGVAIAAVGGTLPYMSPEQLTSLRRPEPIDQRSDVFSFGVLLFQLLTLRLPFAQAPGNSIHQMLASREQGPPAMNAFPRAVPPSIQALVKKCLSFRREDRFASFDEIATDLDRHLRDLPLKHTANPSLRERITKWRRRHPQALSASTMIATAVMLVAVLTSVVAWKSHRLRVLETAATLREIGDRLPEVWAVVSSPYSELESVQEASNRLDEFGEKMGIIDNGRVVSSIPQPALAREYADQFQDVSYLSAHARLRLARSFAAQDRTAWLDSALEFNKLAGILAGDEATKAAIDSQRHRIQRLRDGGRQVQAADSMPVSGSSTLSIVELLYEGRYAQAASLLEQQHRQNPLDFLTLFHLGEAYLGLERISEAESHFTTCISIWPSAYLPVFYRGICRLGLERYRQAEADFDRVLQLRPGFTPAQVNRALALQAQLRLSEAVREVSSAIDGGAKMPRFYFLRSRIKKRMGDAEGAARDYELGMQSMPHDIRDLISRGIAQMKSDPKSALSDFREAIRQNPSSREAWRNIIYVSGELLHQPAEALEATDQMIDRLGETPADLMTRAVLAARLGRAEEAERDVERVIGQSPSDKSWFQAACVYAVLGGDARAEAACDYLRKAVSINMEWAARLQDPDLQSLRSHPGFLRLVELAGAYDKTIKRNE